MTKIDRKLCIGCGECLAVCRSGAITVGWSESALRIQEKIAEYALGVKNTKKNALACMNFIFNVTPNCNCLGREEKPVIRHMGVVASTDPLAVDMAAMNISNDAAGKDLFRDFFPQIDPDIQFAHAEKLGIGTREYDLREI